MFSSNIGLVHTFFAVAAVLAGALVVALPKGTMRHKSFGYLYVMAMLLMNGTALFTQSIYAFGPFHWMAIASLLVVLFGVSAPLFFRANTNWLRIHHDLMLWSYVGLIAAMFSEIAVRVPAVGLVIGGGALFWTLVIGASILTFVVGGHLIGQHRTSYFTKQGRAIRPPVIR